MSTPAVDIEVEENGFSYDQHSNPYRVWRIITTYCKRTGDLLMPCTGGAHALVQTCENPWGWIKTFFFAERAGDWPAIPDPDKADEYRGRAEVDITFHSPELEADGKTWVYRAEAVYFYPLLKPIEIKDGKVLVGGTPFANDAGTEAVPSSLLDSSLTP
jgi:hypothetical protein